MARPMSFEAPLNTQPPLSYIAMLAQSDPSAAARLAWRSAQLGDAAAQTLLAQLLLEGRGVERNPREALQWFRRAAEAGMAIAMNMVGRCLENGWGAQRDEQAAADCYRRAADLDYDWAIYNYAHLLANGRGVERDRAAALRWFKRAADLGHARAMNFIGQYYENGWEVERDPAVAFEWYRRSAQGGDYRGQCSYASVLAEAGRIDAAVELLEQAVRRAPPHFLAALADKLAAAPQAPLRAIAGHIREQLNTGEQRSHALNSAP